jgi:hypothetical protein
MSNLLKQVLLCFYYVTPRIPYFRDYINSYSLDPSPTLSSHSQEKTNSNLRAKTSPIEIRRLLENGVTPISAIKTAELFNYVINHCPDDYSIHGTFRKDALGNALSSTRDLVAQTRTIAEETGFISLINDHFSNTIDGLRADFLPREDTDALRAIGCKDPSVELSGIIQILKLHKDKIYQSIKHEPIETQMLRLEDDIAEDIDSLPETQQENQKNSKKFWKIIKVAGGIVQGAVLTTVNVAPMLLNPALATVTIATSGSIITGIGKVVDSYSDYRKDKEDNKG